MAAFFGTLEYYQDGVVKEKQKLDAKLGKLKDFLNKNPVYLAKVERQIFQRQAFVMGEYSDVLQQHIDFFNGK